MPMPSDWHSSPRRLRDRACGWIGAAQCALRGGDSTAAKELILRAICGTPAQLGLIASYLEQASDDEAHEKLPALLQAAAATETSASTPRGPEWRKQLTDLWVRAATIHARKGDGQQAAQAYERALSSIANQEDSEALTLLSGARGAARRRTRSRSRSLARTAHRLTARCNAAR